MSARFGIAACALALAACGGGTEAPAGSAEGPAMSIPAAAPSGAVTGALDACVLVTMADLAEVHPDVPFGPPESSDRPGAPGQGTLSTCTYTRADATGDQTSIADLREALERAVSVTLMVWTWPDSSGAVAYVQSFIDAGSGPIERIDGLGDEALALSGPIEGVHWRAGKASASVVVSGRRLDDAARREAELALSRRMLARL